MQAVCTEDSGGDRVSDAGEAGKTESRRALAGCLAALAMRRLALCLVVIVVVLDQATKIWAIRALSDGQIVLIPNLLFLHYATNTGAAFSMFAEHPRILTAVAACVAVVVGIWLWKTPASEKWTVVALSLVLGGALGNLTDRLRIEHVIDFIRVYLAPIDWSWPTFNVADSAICVGMGILVLLTFFPSENEHPAKSSESGERQPSA